MSDFTIILDSLDTTSWIGPDVYNATYYINLSQLLDYNFSFTKNYKVSFSFKGSRSLILIGNVIGVYLNNISNSLQTQENLLGLLNTKLLSLSADAVTNENDNSPVYIKNLNNSSILTLNIKTLISQTANTRSYFTGDLLNWYKFLLSDLVDLVNYGTNTLDGDLYGNCQILEDGILSFVTNPSFILLPDLDLTPYATTALTISVWIKTTQTTNITLFVLNSASTFTFRILPSNKSRCILNYGGNITVDYTEAENNNTFKLNNGKWNLVTVVLGNVDTHKLYLNGILVKSSANTVTNLTGVRTNFYFGSTTTGTNQFFGDVADFRLYEKEITPAKIRDYYYTNPLSEKPDYKMKLHFQELKNI